MTSCLWALLHREADYRSHLGRSKRIIEMKGGNPVKKAIGAFKTLFISYVLECNSSPSGDRPSMSCSDAFLRTTYHSGDCNL